MPILHAPESKQSKYETRIANKNKTHFKTWTNQPLLSNQDSDNKITFNIENTHRTNHKMRQIKIWKERNLFSILNIHIQSIYHQKKKLIFPADLIIIRATQSNTSNNETNKPHFEFPKINPKAKTKTKQIQQKIDQNKRYPVENFQALCCVFTCIIKFRQNIETMNWDGKQKKKNLKRTTKKTNLTHEESALPGFGKREEEEESCLHRC